MTGPEDLIEHEAIGKTGVLFVNGFVPHPGEKPNSVHIRTVKNHIKPIGLKLSNIIGSLRDHLLLFLGFMELWNA